MATTSITVSERSLDEELATVRPVSGAVSRAGVAAVGNYPDMVPASATMVAAAPRNALRSARARICHSV